MERSGRAPTQRDVAERAGVSVATVSYIVSGRRDRPNPAARGVTDRVRQAMDELEYRPQRAGRVLQSRRTDLIAVAGYAPLNPWALDVITQVEEVADLHGMGVVILRYGTDGRSVDRAEELLGDGIADASVILFTQAFGSARLKRIGDLRLPTLAFGASAPHRFVDVLTQHEGGLQVSPQLTTIGCEDVDYRPAIERLVCRILAPSLAPTSISMRWELIRRGTA